MLSIEYAKMYTQSVADRLRYFRPHKQYNSNMFLIRKRFYKGSGNFEYCTRFFAFSIIYELIPPQPDCIFFGRLTILLPIVFKCGLFNVQKDWHKN